MSPYFLLHDQQAFFNREKYSADFEHRLKLIQGAPKGADFWRNGKGGRGEMARDRDCRKQWFVEVASIGRDQLNYRLSRGPWDMCRTPAAINGDSIIIVLRKSRRLTPIALAAIP